MNDKEEFNLQIINNMKTAPIMLVYNVTSSMIDYMIIRSITLQLTFFLNTSFNKHISI